MRRPGHGATGSQEHEPQRPKHRTGAGATRAAKGRTQPGNSLGGIRHGASDARVQSGRGWYTAALERYAPTQTVAAVRGVLGNCAQDARRPPACLPALRACHAARPEQRVGGAHRREHAWDGRGGETQTSAPATGQVKVCDPRNPRYNALRLAVGEFIRHDEGGDAIPEQGPGIDRAPPIPVGQPAHEQRAHPQTEKKGRDKAGNPLKAEQSLGGRGEHPAFEQTGRDISGQKQVVKLEQPAQREQDDHIAHGLRGRQAVDARRDGGRAVVAGAGALRRFSADWRQDGAHVCLLYLSFLHDEWKKQETGCRNVTWGDALLQLGCNTLAPGCLSSCAHSSSSRGSPNR